MEYDGGFTRAKSLIIATGGKSRASIWFYGRRLWLCKSFGHTLERPLPALVQIVTESGVPDRLKGVRAKGAVSLVKGQELVTREEGEIQFTEDGLSGICIFDLSRLLGEDPAVFRVQIDLFPEFSSDRLRKLLEYRKEKFANRPAKSLLTGMLHNKLISLYLELAGIDADSSVCQVDETQLLLLSRLLKFREVAVKGQKAG